MKETKVYVDKLPKSCSKCEWCTLNHKDNYGRPFCLIARMPLYNGDKVNEERGQHKGDLSDFDCPIHSTNELVKEVCEKIKLKFSDTRSHNWGIEQFELYEFLDQIQKEFEDE